MANKPRGIGQRPAQEYTKPLVALVEVVTGKTKAKFTILDDKKKFASGEKSITVNLDDLPRHPRLKPEVKEPKQYRIRMNKDGDEIAYIGPASGHFKAKIVDIGRREDEPDADPLPYEKKYYEGDELKESHLEFWVDYEIVEGQFKGVKVPYYLHYKFEESPEYPGYTQFAGNFDNKKATRLFQLFDWGVIHGIWSRNAEDSEPIEWDDNTILPELESRALDADRVVDLTIKDGYIKELLSVESDGEDDEPDFMNEPEEVKPSRNGKSSKPAVKKVVARSHDDEDDL